MRDYAQAKCIPGFLKVSGSCWQVPLVAGLGFGVRLIAVLLFVFTSGFGLGASAVLAFIYLRFHSTPAPVHPRPAEPLLQRAHRLAAYLHESGWPPHLHCP